jgi:hypothetical protein
MVNELTRFESGITWGALLEYQLLSGDARHAQTVSGALANASFGIYADLLGPPAFQVLSGLAGKWNDGCFVN